MHLALLPKTVRYLRLSGKGARRHMTKREFDGIVGADAESVRRNLVGRVGRARKHPSQDWVSSGGRGENGPASGLPLSADMIKASAVSGFGAKWDVGYRPGNDS